MKDIFLEYILPHIAEFASLLLSGFAGFIFGRKKQNAEVESIEDGNILNMCLSKNNFLPF